MIKQHNNDDTANNKGRTALGAYVYIYIYIYA